MSVFAHTKEQNGQQGAKRLSVWQSRLRESWRPWLFVAPAGLLMVFVSLLPQLYQVWMAFTDYRIRNLRFNLFNPATWERYAPDFVGLQNFVRILTNTLNLENFDFWRLLLFNLTWTVVNVVFHVTLGIAIALVLNSKGLIGRRIYRALFVLPWALPSYISALTWKNMYDPRFGFVNQFFKWVNDTLGTHFATDTRWMEVTQPPISFLTFLPLAFYCVLLANIWLGWPFMMVVASGALQSIPHELYEAAAIDGAGAWQQLRKVTLPLLRPAMVPAIMLGTIWTFNQFNVIFFISEGKPFGQTEILVTQAFKLVYQQRLYGVAAAFGILIFFILLALTLLNNRVSRATEAYDV